MRRIPLAASLIVTAAAAGCGSNDPLPNTPAPHMIAGLGIADGPIRGALNVYVIDEDTRNVVSSAAVRVGAGEEQAPCMGLTDSTGLVRFDARSGGATDAGAASTGCTLLAKPVTLTVSATGHAPSTWIGVDGANVTIALRAISAPVLGRATATGTIANWDTLPPPAAQHNRLALVGASSNPALTDRANDIDQGTRSVDVDVGGTIYPIDIASNVCIRSSNPAAVVDDCNWVLTTHSGPQAHFAILLDQDTKGTDDDSDDTMTVTGWALKTGLTLGDGTTAAGEVLPPIADTDMQSFSAVFASGPSGLDYVVALPVLDLG